MRIFSGEQSRVARQGLEVDQGRDKPVVIRGGQCSPLPTMAVSTLSSSTCIVILNGKRGRHVTAPAMCDQGFKHLEALPDKAENGEGANP